MNNFLLPEKIVKSKDSNGKSIFSEIYTIDTFADISLLKVLIYIAIISVLSPIASGIIFLLYCAEINSKANWLNIFGILVAIGFLIDYHYHFIFSTIGLMSYDPQEIYLAICFNIALIFTHFILLFMGPIIYVNADEHRLSSAILVSVMLTMVFFTIKYMADKNLITILRDK